MPATLRSKAEDGYWTITAELTENEAGFPVSNHSWSVTTESETFDTTALQSEVLDLESGLVLTIPYEYNLDGAPLVFIFTSGYGIVA